MVASATGSSQQPGQQFAAVPRGEHAETERLAQPVELLAPCLGPGGVAGECVGADVELLGDEADRRLGDGLARAQQPAGVAEGAELERVAQPVVVVPHPVP